MRFSNRQRYEAIFSEIKGFREDIQGLTREVAHLVRLIIEARRPRRITIRYIGVHNLMPLTMKAGQKVIATATEFDATGVSITPDPTTLQWNVSDTTLATVETNPDGTATVTATAEGSITLSVSETQHNLTSSDVITIEAADPAQPPTGTPVSTEPGEPVTIAISFGTPA